MTNAEGPGLGTMTLTGGYGRVQRAQAISVLEHAVALGGALFDTADVYPGGESLLAHVRAGTDGFPRVVTKVGLRGRPGHRHVCGRPDYLTRACNASLRRLGVERLDVLLLHRVDPDVPVEESMMALGGLARAGKVDQVGLCTSDPAALRRAAAVISVQYVQTALSVLDPSAANTVLPVARQCGASLIAHSPFSRGLIVSSVGARSPRSDDARRYIPEWSRPDRTALAASFRRLAGELGCSPVELALGWLTTLGSDVVAVPGARTVDQVTENFRAQRKHLDADQQRAVEAFVRATCRSRAGA